MKGAKPTNLTLDRDRGLGQIIPGNEIARYRVRDRDGAAHSISGMCFLFFSQNIHCDPSVEPSWRDRSIRGHNAFYCIKRKLAIYYPCDLTWSCADYR